MTSKNFPAPLSDPSTEEFWSAATRRELLIKTCEACGRPHFYPRPFCPFCWSTEVRWATSSGRARVYSYSVVRQNDAAMFRDRVPYVAAIVELAEGPRVMTNLIDVEPSDVRIDMAVIVDFVPAGEDGASFIPVFRPDVSSTAPG